MLPTSDVLAVMGAFHEAVAKLLDAGYLHPGPDQDVADRRWLGRGQIGDLPMIARGAGIGQVLPDDINRLLSGIRAADTPMSKLSMMAHPLPWIKQLMRRQLSLTARAVTLRCFGASQSLQEFPREIKGVTEQPRRWPWRAASASRAILQASARVHGAGGGLAFPATNVQGIWVHRHGLGRQTEHASRSLAAARVTNNGEIALVLDEAILEGQQIG